MEASVAEWLMNLTWNAMCLFCDCRLEPDKAFWVCDECRDNMPEFADDVNNKNLLPLKYFDYTDARVRDAVLSLKYLKNTDKAKPMAETMTANIMTLKKRHDFDFIVPMPSSKKRYNTRGFNQCELIAKEMSKLLGIKYNNKTFRKIKETPPQSTLTYKERLTNLDGAFGIFDEAFEGKRVLLVDDISTTGSTINEAVKTIRKNGDAKLVKAVIFAHT